MTAWFSIDTPDEQERLLAAWGDAPFENEEVLAMILDTARVQVIAYSMGLPDSEIPGAPDELDLIAPPRRLVYAQLQQATNLWNAGRVTSAGEVGMDTYTFTPRPLDKTIRSIIRPLDITNVF